MPPKTKSATEKPLLGQPDSVLCLEFINAVEQGTSYDDILPFSGRLNLPTIHQVLKLNFFLRDQAGIKNSQVSQKDIVQQVAPLVAKYWAMAGYKTMVMSRIEKNITKLLDKFTLINKSRKRTTAGEIKKRADYLESIEKLFDIATPNLVEQLNKDRLLGMDDSTTRYRVMEGYTRKTEDVSFLLDQRGERKMEGVDGTYAERLRGTV